MGCRCFVINTFLLLGLCGNVRGKTVMEIGNEEVDVGENSKNSNVKEEMKRRG